MLAMQQISESFCRSLRGIFCDLDDTLTTGGRLLDVSYSALWQAKRAGLRVVIVTGRPGGWADHIARMWPVDAVVGENGAFYFWMQDGKINRHFVQDATTRQQGQSRLEALCQKILQEVPVAAVASDQKYRESDLAIDYCEDIPPLPWEKQQKILEIFRQAGAQAKLSSIHINGWFGDFDKMSTCNLLLQNLWQEHGTQRLAGYLYCGDSPNDEPMFNAFPHSVGVANIQPFLTRMQSHPTYLTQSPGAQGFAEMVTTVLHKRGQ